MYHTSLNCFVLLFTELWLFSAIFHSHASHSRVACHHNRFNTLAYSTFALFCCVLVGKTDVLGISFPSELTGANNLAFLVGVGPIIYGLVVLALAGDAMPYMWPFHKEKIIGATGIHLVIGTLMAVLPTYHFAATVLKAPGEVSLRCATLSIGGGTEVYVRVRVHMHVHVCKCTCLHPGGRGGGGWA
jgi:hypothetical protein